MNTVDFGNLDLQVSRPGTKVSGATRAELILNPTFNKLSLNGIATNKMGVEHGDFVTIIENKNAESLNEKFFITKGIGEGQQAKLASVTKEGGSGKVLSFNYSGVYSKMLQETTDAIELSPEALEEKELVNIYETSGGKRAYTATKKMFFEIGDAVEAEGIGDIYPLINMKSSPYTGKGE